MALGPGTRAITPPNLRTGPERIRSIVRDTPGVIKFDYDRAKTAFKFKKGATFIHAIGRRQKMSNNPTPRVTVTVHLISGFYASTSLLMHLSLCLVAWPLFHAKTAKIFKRIC